MINTGKLNKKITFQKITQTSNTMGDHPVPETVKTVWANVKAVRGTEYYEAQRIRPEVTFKITCRYFTFLEDGSQREVGPDMRILYRNKTLKIVDAINIDEEDREYEIHAVEVVRKKVHVNVQEQLSNGD
jgi:SPP1 family predicted phage head-tail adaptor